MKFETHHFDMFINNSPDKNLGIGAPLPTASPPPPPPSSQKKSNFSFMVQFCLNLKRIILVCLPIIIEFKNYKLGPRASPHPPSLKKSQILHLSCDFAEI